jgi:hypothetical protein
MLKKVIFISLIVGGTAFLSGCADSSSGNSNSSSDELISADSLSSDAPLKLSEEVISDVIQNISSPVEMASLIKSTGVSFSQKILNDPDNLDEYNTSFKRALNLGVFAADLGYINTFDKNSIVVSYLLAVKNLADGIKVGQFFDFAALKRLASNSNNLDSLMEISVSSFNKMDAYLRAQNRSNVSSLIVTGTWIEGMYITGSVIEQTQNEELINRLGEQKDIVNILLIILENYKNDPNFTELSSHLQGLKDLYSKIKITTEFSEPKKMEVDGSLIIVQDEISHVEITPEQVTAIIDQIKKIRNYIVS